jgi:thiamine pyrophosphokinase
MSEYGKCIIVGAGDFAGLADFDPESDLIIAADGGYDSLRRIGVTPHIIIGDFDSICESETADFAVELLRFPPEKDASDLELAVDEAIRRGRDRMDIYGALGGRLDHTLASIAVLVSLSRRGFADCRLIGVNETIAAVTDGSLTLTSGSAREIVSIFPAGDAAHGVTLTGFKYPLTDGSLTNTTSRGVSNEFAAGAKVATVAVRSGTLVVIRGGG